MNPNQPALDLGFACPCWKCLEEKQVHVWWMVVCPICGHKRCPHANNHELACSNSNESGQPGSAYPPFAPVASTLPPPIGEREEQIFLLHKLKAELTGKLDIVRRYLEGEGQDGDCGSLAVDYGGTGWENDPVCHAAFETATALAQARAGTRSLRDENLRLKQHLILTSDHLKSPQDVYEVVRKDKLQVLEQELASDVLAQAIARMSSAVEARRTGNFLLKVRFLEARGWVAIPYHPPGAPEGVIASPSHPYQRWEKPGYTDNVTPRITDQALKIELKEDTDAVIRLAPPTPPPPVPTTVQAVERSTT